MGLLVGSTKIGGAERQARHLAHGLLGRGDEVVLLVMERPGRRPSSDILDLGGIQTVYLWHGRGREWWSRWRLRRELGRRRVQALLAFNLGAIAFARRALGPLDSPVVVPSVRGLLFTRSKEDRDRLRRACEGAPLLTCNSPAIARGLVEQEVCDESRIRILPNAIAGPAAVTAPSDGNGFRVLFAGSLVEVKEPLLFVEVAIALWKQLPGASFLVAGDGPLRAAMEERVARAGAGTAVRFLGNVPPEAIPFADCHVLVSCSRREGASNVILEALAHGRPVVATRAGGSVEILEASGGGTLVEVGDRDGLIAALRQLAENPARARSLGARGRDYVLEHHDPRRVGQRLTEILGEAIRMGGGGRDA